MTIPNTLVLSTRILFLSNRMLHTIVQTPILYLRGYFLGKIIYGNLGKVWKLLLQYAGFSVA